MITCDPSASTMWLRRAPDLALSVTCIISRDHGILASQSIWLRRQRDSGPLVCGHQLAMVSASSHSSVLCTRNAATATGRASFGSFLPVAPAAGSRARALACLRDPHC